MNVMIMRGTRCRVMVKMMLVALSICLALPAGTMPAARCVGRVLTEHELAYVGLWHASPVLGSGYNERLALNDDRSFVWAASQMDGLERTRFQAGTWAAEGGSLQLRVTKKLIWDGGEEAPAYGSWATDTVIEGADIHTVRPEGIACEDYLLSPVTIDTEAMGKRTVAIGETQYWALDNIMDLKALYAEYNAVITTNPQTEYIPANGEEKPEVEVRYDASEYMENGIAVIYYSGVLQHGSYYHEIRDEWITFYYVEIGEKQYKRMTGSDDAPVKPIEIQVYAPGSDLDIYLGSFIEFTGEWFTAHAIYHQRDIIFEITGMVR
jgi:hypothetical protein